MGEEFYLNLMFNNNLTFWFWFCKYLRRESIFSYINIIKIQNIYIRNPLRNMRWRFKISLQKGRNILKTCQNSQKSSEGWNDKLRISRTLSNCSPKKCYLSQLMQTIFFDPFQGIMGKYFKRQNIYHFE